MSDLLWLGSFVSVLMAGACAGLSSCKREHGDHGLARKFSVWAVGLFAVAVIVGLIAWSS